MAGSDRWVHSTRACDANCNFEIERIDTAGVNVALLIAGQGFPHRKILVLLADHDSGLKATRRRREDQRERPHPEAIAGWCWGRCDLMAQSGCCSFKASTYIVLHSA